MKKYISIFLLVAAAVLGTACSNDNNELPEYAVGLNVVKAQTAFNVVGGTNEVKMASEPAQAYAQDAWLTVTKKAETLLLTAATNTSPQTRNTLLVIKNVQATLSPLTFSRRVSPSVCLLVRISSPTTRLFRRR